MRFGRFLRKEASILDALEAVCSDSVLREGLECEVGDVATTLLHKEFSPLEGGLIGLEHSEGVDGREHNDADSECEQRERPWIWSQQSSHMRHSTQGDVGES